MKNRNLLVVFVLGLCLNTTSVVVADVNGDAISIDPATDQLTMQSNWLELTKTFTDDPVAPGDEVTLEFTLTNLHPTDAASDITFTDDLDAVLSGLEATGLPASVCGGTLKGTDTLTFSGGSLAGDDSCTFNVTLQTPSGSVATVTNTTSQVTGVINGSPVTGAPVSDDLEVEYLSLTKQFDGPTVAGGTPTLTFTIENLNVSLIVSDIGFTDDLDAALSGLEAVGLPAFVCGGEISGVGSLSFAGGELAPGDSCTFYVMLQVPSSASAGSYPNETSEIFSSGIKQGDPASAPLVVEPPPAFSKNFDPNPIVCGGISNLTFTIDNSASVLAATSLDFTDDLPSGVVVADPPNAFTTCTGESLTASAGSGVISYSGGSVAAGATCTVQVDVTSTAEGTHTNTSGDLTFSLGNSGPASDSLTVLPPPVGGHTESAKPLTLLWLWLALAAIAVTGTVTLVTLKRRVV